MRPLRTASHFRLLSERKDSVNNQELKMKNEKLRIADSVYGPIERPQNSIFNYSNQQLNCCDL